MAEIERCCVCDEPTGLGGAADDSLYAFGSMGPYCMGCYPLELDELCHSMHKLWQDGLVERRIFAARIRDLERQCGDLRSAVHRSRNILNAASEQIAKEAAEAMKGDDDD